MQSSFVESSLNSRLNEMRDIRNNQLFNRSLNTPMQQICLPPTGFLHPPGIPSELANVDTALKLGLETQPSKINIPTCSSRVTEFVDRSKKQCNTPRTIWPPLTGLQCQRYQPAAVGVDTRSSFFHQRV